MPGGGVWYARHGALADGLLEVSAIESPEHPDGSILDSDTTQPAVWSSVASDRGIVRIVVPTEAAPLAPRMWFVLVEEPRATIPAVNLVAFTTDDFEPGTVVSKYAFATLGVHNDNQAGAVRWYRDMALVHQIFVADKWRRNQVATMLLHVADGFHQAKAWPGHLHSDGRRTELGQQFVAGVNHPQRFAPLTETMPPMDPS